MGSRRRAFSLFVFHQFSHYFMRQYLRVPPQCILLLRVQCLLLHTYGPTLCRSFSRRRAFVSLLFFISFRRSRHFRVPPQCILMLRVQCLLLHMWCNTLSPIQSTPCICVFVCFSLFCAFF